jgi:pimeloyl-ACP methyl ester carboxylesterase
VPDAHLDHLVSVYAQPGAFTASIGWYRSGAGAVARSVAEQPPRPADRIGTPTTVLWPDHDPLFPAAWSDRLDDYFYFTAARLRHLHGVGHFTPLEPGRARRRPHQDRDDSALRLTPDATPARRARRSARP